MTKASLLDPTELNHHTLAQEWKILQQAYDKYEVLSLVIKLIATLVTAFILIGTGEVSGYDSYCFGMILIAIFWLQDAIWKTFQSRFETRLLAIESAIRAVETSGHASEAASIGMQFNSWWSNSRSTTAGLIMTYLKMGLKPTVAFPYIVFIVLICVRFFTVDIS